MHVSGKIKKEGFRAFGHAPRAGQALPRIWVIVAGVKKARLYRHMESALESIADLSGGWRAEEYFLRCLADWLEQAVREDAFDRLVVIAAPPMLERLRGAFSQRVHARIVAEISRELSDMDERTLSAALKEIVWF